MMTVKSENQYNTAMKFESKAKKPSVRRAHTNATVKGEGLPWSNMNQQCRFTSGEIRTIQMGYALVVFSIAVYAILTTTVVVPALRSQALRETRCRVTSSEIVKVPNSRFGNKGGCGLVANSMCVQVYVLYQTNELRQVMSRRSDVIRKAPSLKFYKDSNRNATVDNISERTVRRSQERLSRTIRAIVRYDELQSEQEQCTVRPKCTGDNGDDKKTYRKLVNLKKTLGRIGLRVPCYYDPMKFGHVILKKRFDGKSVFNCLIWPTIFLVIGVTLIALVHCCIGRYKSRIAYSEKAPSKTKQKIRSLNNSLRMGSVREPNNGGKTKTQKGHMFYSAGNVGVGMTKFHAK